jgi:hypothetical protein
MLGRAMSLPLLDALRRTLRVRRYTRQHLHHLDSMLAGEFSHLLDGLRLFWPAFRIRTRHSLGPQRRRVRVTIRFFGGRRCVFVRFIGHCVSFPVYSIPARVSIFRRHVRPMLSSRTNGGGPQTFREDSVSGVCEI